MTHKFTPSPWYVGGHPGDDSGTGWRQVLTDSQEFGPSYICQALERDARLIAAAPDLLVALENALNVLAGIATGQLATVRRDSPAIAAARDAIAKATGE